MLAGLIIVAKYAIGIFCAVMAAFCTFAVLDISWELVKQATTGRKSDPLTHFDVVDYINTLSIGSGLALLSYWVVYRVFF